MYILGIFVQSGVCVGVLSKPYGEAHMDGLVVRERTARRDEQSMGLDIVIPLH